MHVLVCYMRLECSYLDVSFWIDQIHLHELLCVFRVEGDIENSTVFLKYKYHISVCLSIDG